MPAFQEMTTTRGVRNGDTNPTTTLRSQIFHQTSVDLQSHEGFFVRRRKVPQPNCLTLGR